MCDAEGVACDDLHRLSKFRCGSFEFVIIRAFRHNLLDDFIEHRDDMWQKTVGETDVLIGLN